MPRYPTPESDMARFLAKVEKTETCWLWTAARKSHGYGNMFYRSRLQIAHRVSWMLHRGEIPEGMVVCHACDVRCCVNPDHLFLGTVKDNARDMAVKERSRSTKLTAPQVREIRRRRASGETLVSLGAEYGVSYATIWQACSRNSWGHVA